MNLGLVLNVVPDVVLSNLASYILEAKRTNSGFLPEPKLPPWNTCVVVRAWSYSSLPLTGTLSTENDTDLSFRLMASPCVKYVIYTSLMEKYVECESILNLDRSKNETPEDPITWNWKKNHIWRYVKWYLVWTMLFIGLKLSHRCLICRLSYDSHATFHFYNVWLCIKWPLKYGFPTILLNL